MPTSTFEPAAAPCANIKPGFKFNIPLLAQPTCLSSDKTLSRNKTLSRDDLLSGDKTIFIDEMLSREKFI